MFGKIGPDKDEVRGKFSIFSNRELCTAT